jgi:hypothetical protein
MRVRYVCNDRCRSREREKRELSQDQVSQPVLTENLVSPILHSMNWTTNAETKLKEVPFFVRPIVRRRIEGLASEAGQNEIDEAFYEQAKAQFGEK